jgi:hypothetical protein
VRTTLTLIVCVCVWVLICVHTHTHTHTYVYLHTHNMHMSYVRVYIVCACICVYISCVRMYWRQAWHVWYIHIHYIHTHMHACMHTYIPCAYVQVCIQDKTLVTHYSHAYMCVYAHAIHAYVCERVDVHVCISICCSPFRWQALNWSKRI